MEGSRTHLPPCQTEIRNLPSPNPLVIKNLILASPSFPHPQKSNLGTLKVVKLKTTLKKKLCVLTYTYVK